MNRLTAHLRAYVCEPINSLERWTIFAMFCGLAGTFLRQHDWVSHLGLFQSGGAFGFLLFSRMQRAHERQLADIRKQGLQEWLAWRLLRYEDSEVHRRFAVANQVRDLRDASLRLASQLTQDEAGALARAYLAIQQRLAPGLDLDLS